MIKIGDKLKCVEEDRDGNTLTLGKEYIALTDEVEGVFIDRPFITVNGNNDKISCHASRFEVIKEQGTYVKYEPEVGWSFVKQDRVIMKNDCPVCGAPAGYLCKTTSGTTLKKPHKSRIQGA